MNGGIDILEQILADDTWAGIIATFLAAILGISYPLLLQYIEKIGLKYHSDNVSKHFAKSWQCKWYKYSLIAAIIAFFYAYLVAPFMGTCFIPFMQNSFGNHSAVLLAFLCLVATIVVFLCCCQLVHTYLYPASYLLSICKCKNLDELLSDLSDRKPLNDKELVLVCDILYVSYEENLPKVRQACSNLIGYYYFAIKQAEPNVIVKYDNFTYTTFLKLAEKYLSIPSGRKETNAIIMPVLVCLFDEAYHKQLSLETMQHYWKLVTDFIHADKKKDILHYWGIAEQYWAYQIKEHIEEREQEAKLFKMQHIMLAAYMLYYKKYDLLDEILFYTNSRPARFYLIPSTLDEIVDCWKEVEQMYHQKAYTFVAQFDFMRENKGVDQEEFIETRALAYLTLLVARLPQVQSYIYRTDNLIRNANSYRGCKDTDKEKNIIKRMEFFMDRNKESYSALDFDLSVAKQILKDWNAMLNLKEEELKSEKKIFRKGVDDLLIQAHEAFNRSMKWLNRLPFPQDEGLEMKALNPVYSALIDISEFDTNTYQPSVNLYEFISAYMAESILDSYVNLFDTNKINPSYSIDIPNVWKAIDRMKLDANKHIVIGLGIDLGYYKDMYASYNDLSLNDDHYDYHGIQVYYLNARNAYKAVVVLDKSKMPVCKTMPIYTDANKLENTDLDYTSLDNKNAPYMSIQVKQGFRNDKWEMYAKCSAQILTPKQWKCCSLTIKYDNFNENEANDYLQKIKPIVNLFCY